MQVSSHRADWTYALGQPASFRVTVTRDGYGVPGAPVAYTLRPERMKPTEAKTVAGARGGACVVKAKASTQPGFLRLVATAKVDGQDYRGLATAGYAPTRSATVPRAGRLRRVLGPGQEASWAEAGRREAPN